MAAAPLAAAVLGASDADRARLMFGATALPNERPQAPPGPWTGYSYNMPTHLLDWVIREPPGKQIFRVVFNMLQGTDRAVTRVLLPIEAMPDGGRLRVRIMKQSSASLVKLPPLGVPPTMEQSFMEFQQSSDTWGIAIQMEGRLLSTPTGTLVIGGAMRRITDGVNDLLTQKGLCEILNSDRHPLMKGTTWADGRDELQISMDAKDFRTMMAKQFERWNMLNQRTTGTFVQLTTTLKQQLQRRNNIKPNALMIPQGSLAEQRLRQEAFNFDNYSDGRQFFRRAGMIRTDSGMAVLESPMMRLKGSKEFSDALVTPRTVGQHHLMRHGDNCSWDNEAPYKTIMRSVQIEDFQGDSTMKTVTLQEAFEYSGLYARNSPTATNLGRAVFRQMFAGNERNATVRGLIRRMPPQQQAYFLEALEINGANQAARAAGAAAAAPRGVVNPTDARPQSEISPKATRGENRVPGLRQALTRLLTNSAVDQRRLTTVLEAIGTDNSPPATAGLVYGAIYLANAEALKRIATTIGDDGPLAAAVKNQRPAAAAAAAGSAGAAAGAAAGADAKTSSPSATDVVNIVNRIFSETKQPSVTDPSDLEQAYFTTVSQVPGGSGAYAAAGAVNAGDDGSTLLENAGEYFRGLMERDKPLPLDFVLDRSITHLMGSGLAMDAGPQTGATYAGEADFRQGDDAQTRSSFFRFQIDAMAALFAPQNIAHAHNITSHGYMCGGRVAFWDPLNPMHVQMRNRNNETDVGGITVYPMEVGQNIGMMFDNTGRHCGHVRQYTAAGVADRDYPNLPSAISVGKHWGLQSGEAFDITFPLLCGGKEHVITSCSWRGPTYLPKILSEGNGLDYTKEIQGFCHWGPRSFAGIGPLRMGKHNGVPVPGYAQSVVAFPNGNGDIQRQPVSA